MTTITLLDNGASRAAVVVAQPLHWHPPTPNGNECHTQENP